VRAREDKERSVMPMNDMTHTLLAAGIPAGMKPKRDRVAVAGGAH
jgi:hypothetical protein